MNVAHIKLSAELKYIKQSWDLLPTLDSVDLRSYQIVSDILHSGYCRPTRYRTWAYRIKICRASITPWANGGEGRTRTAMAGFSVRCNDHLCYLTKIKNPAISCRAVIISSTVISYWFHIYTRLCNPEGDWLNRCTMEFIFMSQR